MFNAIDIIRPIIDNQTEWRQEAHRWGMFNMLEYALDGMQRLSSWTGQLLQVGCLWCHMYPPKLELETSSRKHDKNALETEQSINTAPAVRWPAAILPWRAQVLKNEGDFEDLAPLPIPEAQLNRKKILARIQAKILAKM